MAHISFRNGVTSPGTIDLFSHGLGWRSHRYATVRGSEGQDILILICAGVSARNSRPRPAPLSRAEGQKTESKRITRGVSDSLPSATIEPSEALAPAITPNQICRIMTALLVGHVFWPSPTVRRNEPVCFSPTPLRHAQVREVLLCRRRRFLCAYR